MRILRLTVAMVAISVIAGCSDTTGLIQPSTPRLNGGGLVGSGNRGEADINATPDSDTLSAVRSNGLAGIEN